ncbi:GAF domain-containing SpoIIE family protein phosphatase [Spirochaetia bacterium 38H-sp]|uniref:GAF domain-containing SpoIIE family protein phosphatase n=1 Tax=Rarispira pelagica TaxID=3141764 RepID=A0ABU9U919_9SPIR
MGDISFVALSLLWIRTYSSSRNTDIIVIIISSITAITIFLLNFLGVFNITIILGIIPLSIITIYFLVEYTRISIHNTEGAEDIIGIRPFAILTIISSPFLSLFTGYNNSAIGQFFLIFPIVYSGIIVMFYVLKHINKQEFQNQRLTQDIENLFDFMKKVSSVTRTELQIDRILQYVTESTMQNVDADGAAILILDEFDPTIIRVRAVSGFYPPPFPVPQMVKTKSSVFEEYFRSQQIPIAADNVLSETVREVKPIFIRNSAQDDRLKHNRGDDLLYLSSFISVPLIANNRVFGVLSLIKRRRNRYFTQNDFSHILTFADYSSLIIDTIYTYIELLEKREMEREVNIAAEIQQKLIPQYMPEISTLDLRVHSIPLHGVSGDYYDIFTLDENKLALFMCDVAGKGVPAALIMVMIHSILHLIASPNRDPAVTLTWLNRGLFGRISVDHYATVSYAIYDSEKRVLEYTNAAHHPLIVIRPSDKKIFKVDTRGLPIGIEQNIVYEKKSIPLQKGDIAILYTDGITEAMNKDGEQYGLERLLKILLANAEKDIEEITETVKSDLAEFVGRAKQHDDQTFLLLKVK